MNSFYTPITSKPIFKLTSWIILFTWITWTFSPIKAYGDGEIVAANERTYKYEAPNGVPVVNISRPNSTGLSHNEYKRFSVDSRGVVLTNTNEVLKSQLAGAIRGNPNILPGKEASIILNEVVNANRSMLNGFIEVHGKIADVIVANPWGITADGVGFINTSRAMLTTGVPNIDVNGTLQGFRVNRGDLLISGAGINASKQNYLDLVARSIKIDGQINAQNLHITTGANEWSYENRTSTALAMEGGTAPDYAIDTSLLGGMYANKIKLVATENGVGVRMLGDMAATAEDIVITSAGTIELKNKTSAETSIDITYNGTSSDGKILVSGDDTSVSAKVDITFKSTKGVEFSQSEINAENNLSIMAATMTDNGLATDVRSARNNIAINTLGKTEINGTKWIAGDNLSAETGEFKIGTKGAELYSGADTTKEKRSIRISATKGDINLATAKIASPKDIILTAINSAIRIAGGSSQKIEASNDIFLNAKTDITNSGILLSANNMTIRSTNSGTLNLINSGGRLQAGNIMDIAGYGGGNALDLANQANGVILGNTLKMKTRNLTNASGATIQGTQGSTIDVTNSLSNSGKFIASDSADKSGTFNVGTLNNKGTLSSKGNLSLNIAKLSLTNSSSLLAANNLTIRSTNNSTLNLTNSARLQAGGSLDIAGYGGGNALNLTNQKDGVILGNTLSVKAYNLTNASGATIQGTQGSTIDVTNSLSNSGKFIASDSADKSGTFNVGTLNNKGTLSSKGNLSLNIAKLSLTNSSSLLAANNLTIRSTNNSTLNLTNSARLQAGGSLDIAGYGGGNALNLTNQKDGVILGNTLSVKAYNLTNALGATIQGTKGSTIDVRDTLSNSGKFIASDSSSYSGTFNVGTLNNQGALSSKGNLSLNIARLSLTNSGDFLSANNMTIRSTSSGTLSLTNSGRLQAGGCLDIAGYGGGNALNLSNYAGVILGNTLNVKASNLSNDSGATIQGTYGSTIDVTNTLANRGKFIVSDSSGYSGTFNVGTLDNKGTLSSKGNLSLNIANLNLNLPKGSSLLAGNNMTIRPTTNGTLNLTNSAKLQAGGCLDIAGYNNSNALNLTNQTDGVILGNTLSLKATSLNNNSGATLQATKDSTIDVTHKLTNAGLLILSTEDKGTSSTLEVATIENIGTIQSEGTADVILKNSGSLENKEGAKLLAGCLWIKSGSASGMASVRNYGIIESTKSATYIMGHNYENNLNLIVGRGAVVNSQFGGLDIRANTIDIHNYGTIQIKKGPMFLTCNKFSNLGTKSLLINKSDYNSFLKVTSALVNKGAIHGNGNFTITTGILKNTNTAGISSRKTLDITTSTDFTNEGALYAGENLKLTAIGKSITNKAKATMDSSGDIDINTGDKSGAFTNYWSVNAKKNININTGEFKNITGAAEGLEKETVVTFEPLTKDELGKGNNQKGGCRRDKFWGGCFGKFINPFDPFGSWVEGTFEQKFYFLFDHPSYGTISDDEAVMCSFSENGIPWSIYQFYRNTWDDGRWYGNDQATACYYLRGVKKIVTETYPLPPETIKAQIIAGNDLTINMTNGKNIGAIMSAGGTMTLSGSGKFTNNALKGTRKIYWVRYGFAYASYDEDFCNNGATYRKRFYTEDSPWSKDGFDENWGGWTEKGADYRSWGDDNEETVKEVIAEENKAKEYALKNGWFETTEDVGGVGAGIFAGTLIGNFGKKLENLENPLKPSSNPISKPGTEGASADKGVSASGLGSGVSASGLGSGVSASGLGSGVGSQSLEAGLSVMGLSISLPTNPNGYFVRAKSSNAAYLIEVNPRFGLDAPYLGSDYLFKKLNTKSGTEKIIRRLGDAAYENHLIRQQMIVQTGRDVLKRFKQNAELQTRSLFDAAAEASTELKLTWGVALTKEQVNKLKTDIVWMVKTVVDGQEVLAPVVYLCQATKNNVTPDGAVISADVTDIKMASLDNIGGLIEGEEKLALKATEGDITNISGKIRGGEVSVTTDKGNIINKTFTQEHSAAGGELVRTNIGKTASIEATKSLEVHAALDIKNIGAEITSQGDGSVTAGRDIILDTIVDKTVDTEISATYTSEHKLLDFDLEKFGQDLYDQLAQEVLNAGQQLVDQGQQLASNYSRKLLDEAAKKLLGPGGKLLFDAFGKPIIDAQSQKLFDAYGKPTAEFSKALIEEYSKTLLDNSTKPLFDNLAKPLLKYAQPLADQAQSLLGLGETTTSSTYTKQTRTTEKHIGANIKVGGNLKMSSGRDLTVAGSKIKAEGNAEITAGRDEKFIAREDIDRTQTYTETTETHQKRTLLSSSSSKKTTTTEKVDEKGTAVVSSIEVGGDLTRKAERELYDEGTKITVGGDYEQKAKKITLAAAKDRHDVTEKTTIEKSSSSSELSISTSGIGANVEMTATKETQDTKEKSTTAVVSDIKVGGRFKSTSDEKTRFEGTKVTTGGSIEITAKEFEFDAARDTYAKEEAKTSTTVSNTLEVNIPLKPAGKADLGKNTFAHSTTRETSSLDESKAVVGKFNAGKNIVIKTEGKIDLEGTQIEAGESYIVDDAGKGSYTHRAAYDTKTSKKTVEKKDLTNVTTVGRGDTSASILNTLEVKHSKDTLTTGERTAHVGTVKVGKDVVLSAKEKIELEGTQMEGKGSFIAKTDKFDYKAAYDTKEAHKTSSTETHKAEIEAKATLGLDDGGKDSKPKGSVRLSYEYGDEKSKESEKSATAKTGKMDFGKKIDIKSTKDARFEGTDISGGEKVDIVSTKGSVAFDAARDTSEKISSETKWHVGGEVELGKGGKGIEVDGTVKGGYATSKEKETSSVAKAGSIKAGKGGVSVSARKDVKLEGTDVASEGGVSFEAKEGDFMHLAAKSTHEKSIDGWSAEGKIKGGTSGVDVEAKGSYRDAKSSSVESKVGTVSAKGDYKVKAGRDATFEGTEVEAGGKIGIDAKGDVNILAAQDSSKEKDLDISAEVSFGTGKQTSVDARVKYLDKEKKEHKVASFKSGSDTSIIAGKAITMEATEIDSGGEVKLAAKEDIKFKAVADIEKSIEVSTGVGFSGENKEEKTGTRKEFELSGGYKHKETHKGVKIKSKSDIDIDSGGKVIKEGAEIKSEEGKESIKAAKGVESTALKKDVDVEVGGGFKYKDDGKGGTEVGGKGKVKVGDSVDISGAADYKKDKDGAMGFNADANVKAGDVEVGGGAGYSDDGKGGRQVRGKGNLKVGDNVDVGGGVDYKRSEDGAMSFDADANVKAGDVEVGGGAGYSDDGKGGRQVRGKGNLKVGDNVDVGGGVDYKRSEDGAMSFDADANVKAGDVEVGGGTGYSDDGKGATSFSAEGQVGDVGLGVNLKEGGEETKLAALAAKGQLGDTIVEDDVSYKENGEGMELAAKEKAGDVSYKEDGEEMELAAKEKAGDVSYKADLSATDIKKIPKKAQKIFNKVDRLMKAGKSLDEALKSLGIDKNEYLKMKEKYK